MANPPAILIRADANADIGTGHVMRCLALAQEWQQVGGRAVFAMAAIQPALRDKLLHQSFESFLISSASNSIVAGSSDDANRTAALARDQKASWIVVDGYHFGSDYQRQLKSERCRVLFLDDFGHAAPYSADLVMNQNISAEESLYTNRAPYTRCLLGPQYCLLRNEFNAWREWHREIAPLGRRVLVTMGGSDPQQLSERAIRALTQVDSPDLEAAIVVGAGKMGAENLESIADSVEAKITLHRDVSNMPELMAWADAAISAAGTTTWELCLMGLPAILITAAENQVQIARQLAQRECAIYLGDASEVQPRQISGALRSLLMDQNRRRAISSRCRQIVDGQGAARVVRELLGEDFDSGSGAAARPSARNAKKG